MEKPGLAIGDIQPRSRRNSVASLFGPPRLTNATPRQIDAPGASSAPGGDDHSAEKVAPPNLAKTLNRRLKKGSQPIIESVSQKLNVKILEVIQSNWIPNDDGNQEKISLIGELTNLQSASIEDGSFRWIHFERDTASINFADFEKVLNDTRVLYTHEAAVASKCLKEVALNRRTFARGKYFGPYIHQASLPYGSEVEVLPVSATFLSFPIFALMSIPHYGGDVHANSRNLRSSDQHPIRSLLQYSNILAKTTKRDTRQVVTRDEVEDDGQAPNHDKPFIHVPEIWALVINMYTIITCAPFSLDELCCDNVKVHNPPRQDQKVLVKYTDLHGRLHDFRCRTWFGLLDIVSSIESHVDKMKSLLNNPESQYKLIDPRFRPIDNTRWLEIVEATGARSVNVRGVTLLEDSALSLDFAERKLRASIQGTFVLLGYSVTLRRLRERAMRFQVEKVERAKQDQVKKRIALLSKEARNIKRSRHFNRFLLYATRSQILDPHASDAFKQTEAQIPIGQTNRSTTGSTIAEDCTDQRKKNSNPLESTAVVRHLPEVFENKLKIPTIKVDTQEDEQTRTGAPKIQPTTPRITLNDEHINQSPKTSAALVLPPPVAASGNSEPTRKKSPSYQSIVTDDLEAQRSPVEAFEDLESQRRSRLHSVLPLQKHSSHAESSLGLAGPSIVDPLSADSLGQGVQDMSHLTSLPHITPENSLSQGIRRPTQKQASLQDTDSVDSKVFPASPPRLPLRPEGGSTILRSEWNALNSSSSQSESAEHPSSEESPNAGALPYPQKNDTTLIQYAATQLEQIEQKCNQLLLDGRPEPTNDKSSPNWRLPSALTPTFRDIVLFLLCIYLAVTDHGVDSMSVHHIRDKVLGDLAESESALLRLSEHAEMELDQSGHESIRTADTILEILVENAMSFSTKEELDKKGRARLPFFDLVHIYSSYTSSCIFRAKRDASARVYEDVRLLREEVETISLMLKDQKDLFRKVLKARGSTPETLDKRLTHRIQSSLDETIRHFDTLSVYAVQAEFWTRNSIEVKGEDNSKAIYVFTAVTVIFLPLTFIAGLLGMNTVDIRNEQDSQWLFWAIALPFTFTVLMICLCIAKLNFRLRKFVRSVLRKSGVLRKIRKGLGILGRRLLPEKWYRRGTRRAADWIDSVRDEA
ncbi:hypothetical protein EPUS_00028 [Endocarpon pusillum Z07020]|uniref:Uncharacterized protein n=1 Tax=Endocarpon pusillum (strain Z07020 / HMAS-L-300199) TaxID=1263415 RepID=U1GTA1_ENDPU|nr:uncharacterized protein EPUS_00028 [Endocarpon pusillum Z07020]ERF75236.1 hypothetical protein EPUS_00028 [Endocarpon pusillum Z07020]